MLLASLKLVVDDIGVHRLAPWLGEYTGAIAAGARALGFRVPSKHAPHIVGLRPGHGMPDAATIVERLARRRPKPVLVSERLGAIRISPHVYNTREDLEVLLAGLRDAVADGAPTSRL